MAGYQGVDEPVVGTPIGSGCRVEGPHGPTPCGQPWKDGMAPDVLDGSECSCGCSAFEDCCETYLKWHQEQYR